MDKDKGRWKAIPYEDDWDYISKKFNLADKDWDQARPASLDKYKKDKITLNEFDNIF